MCLSVVCVSTVGSETSEADDVGSDGEQNPSIIVSRENPAIIGVWTWREVTAGGSAISTGSETRPDSSDV